MKSILEEMGHNFNLSSIRVMAFMLRKILCTLFRRVLINREGLERVRKVTISIHVKLLLQCVSIQFWAFVFFPVSDHLSYMTTFSCTKGLVAYERVDCILQHSAQYIDDNVAKIHRCLHWWVAVFPPKFYN